MRQKRTRRSRKSSGNWGNIIIFFVLAPILAILIAVGLYKYLLLPYIEPNDNPSNIEVGTSNDENNSQINNSYDNNDTESPNNTESFVTLKLKGLTLFNVQLGSFSSKENAQTLVDELKDKEINGYMFDSNGFKVFAGTFFTRGEAEKYRDELKNTYSDAFIKEFYTGGTSIEYLVADQQFEDEIVDLVSTIGDFFSEESSLWTIAIGNESISSLKEKTISNNNVIDTKLASIKGKVKSESLQNLIDSFESHNQERKEMINNLIDNDSKSIINSYEEFNNILLKYMKTITQGQWKQGVDRWNYQL